MSLTQKGFSSFVYSFSSSIINKIIVFVGGVYLARLLTPQDYGLVAMLYIIFAVSSFFITGGLGLALIREKIITEADKSTVFYFNIIVSISLYILLWFGAPLIASFYGRQELIMLTRLMGLDLLFKSLTIVQASVLKRELKFKFLSLIEVVSGITVIGISVFLAYSGYGVIALAIKFFLGSLVSSIMLFIVNPWIPRGFITKESFHKLFAFGSNVMLLGFVNSISKNLNQVVIGKYFSPASLGFFNQGNMLKDTATSVLNDTVMNVTFPMLAQIQDDKERLKLGYQRIIRINTFTLYPIITILIIAAEPLIIGLLGEKWRVSIVFLQILGISGYVGHLHSINLNVLKVYGKGKDYLFQGFFRNGLTILGILITVNISVVAMAWAFVITEFLQLFINVYYSNKYISFTFKEQWTIMFPIILITIIMGMFVYLLGYLDFSHPLVKLTVLSFSGIILYLVLAYLFKLKALGDLKLIIGQKLKSLKKKKK
ncbi:lipopolysaccharide biosynthesis protein [Aequorivita sp. H23M31]|uniref:Lipopolysaccharide biosynthesis protein n=1 Tax=Aequorivita ciconiae TaxID=2494375 RepID=A0A410G207_9FLAO|nr:lipopolysaccharide biosynthesis protein [Aequorivita sp. H23M31]QAA81304.1 lipopolysaccharide biosynthesis protein [Aequorivita sp. H23M31]